MNPEMPSAFRVGQTERLIYEKVGGLKACNLSHSILYNFGSEGVFAESEAAVGLINPTFGQIYSGMRDQFTNGLS
jgi:hypothetical protein